MGEGCSNRTRKHCFLIMCILSLQPRRPIPGCLLGFILFHKESQGWTPLMRNLESPKLQNLVLWSRFAIFPKKWVNDSIPRLATDYQLTEDPKLVPTDNLESGRSVTHNSRKLSGRLQCGGG